MSNRRPLSIGIEAPAVDPETARKFIHGEKAPTQGEEESIASAPKQSSPAQNLSRVPISTRIRSDFATALKRCSLERQLKGEEPNTLQDILEQAIEPWLKSLSFTHNLASFCRGVARGLRPLAREVVPRAGGQGPWAKESRTN